MVAVILEEVTHNWKWTDGPVRMSILRHEQRQPGDHGGHGAREDRVPLSKSREQSDIERSTVQFTFLCF